MQDPFAPESYDSAKAQSPASKFELYLIARRIELMISVVRREMLCLHINDMDALAAARVDFERYQNQLDDELKTLILVGHSEEELLL